MDAIVIPALDLADKARGFVLRALLSFSFARLIYTDRAWRLQFLFLVAFVFYLGLASVFPLWVLLAGPIIWGVPHLFASVRYSHHALKTEDSHSALPSFGWLASLWITVMGIRLVSDLNPGLLPSSIAYTNYPELTAAVLSLIGCAVLYRRSVKQSLAAFALLAPLAFFSLWAPGETIGALVLLHNFVAFFFWYKSSKTKRERGVSLFSFALFVIAHVVIFAGAFDFLTYLVNVDWTLQDGSLDVTALGRMIAPWSEDPTLAYHCVVAYAFGQALHYFIWMKAIPDQHHDREVPTTFRQSYHLLRAEYGHLVVPLILAICLISIATWMVFEFHLARGIYFGVAAYHGYLEIGVLGLVLLKVKPSGSAV